MALGGTPSSGAPSIEMQRRDVLSAGDGRDDGEEEHHEEEHEDESEHAPLVRARASEAPTPAASKPASGAGRVESVSSVRRGMVLYALGAFFGSLTALSARLLHDAGVAVHILVLLRSAIAWCVASALVARLRWRDELPPGGFLGTRRAMLCARATLGACAVYCFFCTAALLPLADAAVPSFVAPLVTAVVAAAVLRERPSEAVWIALPLCLLGAVLVVQPTALFGASGRRLPAVGVAAAAAQTVFGGTSKVAVRILSGGVVVSSRVAKSSSSSGAAAVAQTDPDPRGKALLGKEHPLVMMWYTNMVAATGGLVFAAFTPDAAADATAKIFSPLFVAGAPLWHPDNRALLLTLASALFGFAAQFCITAALGRAPASAVMPLHYTAVVWAVLWGQTMLGETLGGLEATGIGIVAAASAYATWKQTRAESGKSDGK